MSIGIDADAAGIDIIAISVRYRTEFLIAVPNWFRYQHLRILIPAPNRTDATGCRPPPPFLLRVAEAGRNLLNEEITPLLPSGIGER
jgi:hypothetical protein